MYFFFLDILMCGLLQLSFLNFDGVDNTSQWVIVLLIVVILLGFNGFVFSLIFMNGPYFENFYLGSAIMSIFQIR